MSYKREFPRDLFNEAKLLKCLAVVTLKIHDKKIEGLFFDHVEPESGFKIEQDLSSGDIFVSNLQFRDNEFNKVCFSTSLNSKYNFPLLMSYKDEEYYPISEKGDYQLAENLFTK